MAKKKTAAKKTANATNAPAVKLAELRGNFEARYENITGEKRPVSMGFIEAFRKHFGDDEILSSGSLEQIFAHYEQ